jgi:phosphoribosylglycinamide formyltransferase 1
MRKIVILISGRGSNMQSILDANIDCEIVAVISNRPDAGGLEIAAAKGVHTEVLDHKAFANRAAFDLALAQKIRAFSADFIVLAGFMRVLSAGFVDAFAGKIINIHPSLLPSFPGLATHEQALATGVKIHGCTVHIVTAALDHGPILAQAAVPVFSHDDARSLGARVLAQEHKLYPQVLRWLCAGKMPLSHINSQNHVVLQGAACVNSACLVQPEE